MDEHERDERWLSELFADHGRALLGYAVRRVDVPADAADVVAETFTVAWRRRVDVPDGDEARLWLYGWVGGCSPTTAEVTSGGRT